MQIEERTVSKVGGASLMVTLPKGWIRYMGIKPGDNATKRIRRRDNALYLVFKSVERLSTHWRPLNGGVNLMTLVLEGETFKDGILKRRETRELVDVIAWAGREFPQDLTRAPGAPQAGLYLC